MHRPVRLVILTPSSPHSGRFAPFGRCGCPVCIGHDLEGVLRLWDDDRIAMARAVLAQVATAQAEWRDVNIRSELRSECFDEEVADRSGEWR